MKRAEAPNWLDLQDQLDWLANGVVVNGITIEQYIDRVRELLDNFEFMAGHRGQ